MVGVKLLSHKSVAAIIFVALLIYAGVMFKSYLDEYTSHFIDHTIYSSTLKENRKIFIRLPEVYDNNKRYPLIIKSDGNFNLKRWDESISKLS